jgi:septal ring factor EnvC (AmiA/AmiB activator)
MELKELNDRVDRLAASSWERSKAIANTMGDLTVRIARLERTAAGVQLASELKELAQRIANLEHELSQLQTDTFISRNLGNYGSRLVELLAEVVAQKLDRPGQSQGP